MSPAMNHYWSVLALLALGTLLLRASFIAAGDRLRLPEAFRRMLAYIPPAVLSALIAPAIVYGDASYALDWRKLLAGVAAAAIAWRTQNIPVTIAAGLAFLWALRMWL